MQEAGHGMGIVRHGRQNPNTGLGETYSVSQKKRSISEETLQRSIHNKTDGKDFDSPPATPHRLQNLKWPLGGLKMTDGVWKVDYP